MNIYKQISMMLIVSLMLIAIIAPVSAVRHYEANKYVNTDPTLNVGPFDGSGHLYINLRAGGGVVDGGLDFYVINKANPEQTKNWFKINPSGTYDDFFAPGDYIIVLPQGDGSAAPANYHEERTEITIVAKQTYYVTFKGNAYSGISGPEVTGDSFTIIEATYGATECSQVIDVDAHTEYRHWIAEVGHWTGHGRDKHWFVDTPAHWSEWSNNEPEGYTENGHHACEYNHRHIAATYKTICNGETKDVTQNVKDVVSQGVTSFLFRNDYNPGGIFDVTSTTLLSEIEDPAYPIVKNVMIKYSKNGVEKTINTMEYNIINL
jgi:hypothetical protein